MKKEIHILVVEDDEDINQLISSVLKKHSYTITNAYSGTEAKLLLSMQSFDLILLDLMLPGISGEELVKQVREKSYVPIIILSAKAAVDDKVNLLKIGADDYMTKPFEISELTARVEAQLRRYCKFADVGETKERITYKEISLDPESRLVMVKGEEMSLTTHEFDILLLFMSNVNRVYTREAIYNAVWNEEYVVEDNTVNVHISNLRAKLKKLDPDTEYIKTVWGIGFKMV